jgi:hypothetical protein
MIINSTTTCHFYNPVNLGGNSWSFGSSTCQTAYLNNTSTEIIAKNGFSYGEIVNSVFLFLILMVALYSFLWFSLNRLKIDFKQK